MDPRLQLYQDIVQAVHEQVPEIGHIDLWNQNVYYMEQDCEWQRPALFVEIGDIEWQPMKQDSQGRYLRGSGDVRLHIVTDWSEDAYATSFELGDKIWRALEDHAEGDGKAYRMEYPKASLTNHDHEAMLENIDVLGAHYVKRW